MSRKAPLYDPNMINEDLRCGSLSDMALLLFAKLAALANIGGGYIKIGPVCVTLEKAAVAVNFRSDLGPLVQEIMDMGLLAEDDAGWHIPEIKAAQEVRDKKRRAGSAGGQKTTAGRSDVRNVIEFPRKSCLSKPKNEAKSVAYSVPAKKEKRTKKEKNNKYIYISGLKVFTGDRGNGDNFKQFDGDNFTVYRREYEALQQKFSRFDDDKIYDLLAAHDDWMGANPGVSEEFWFVPLISGWSKLHAKLAA